MLINKPLDIKENPENPQEGSDLPYYDFIIIGAGISGLYAAFKLKKQNYKVLVLEAASEVGGTWKSIPYLNSVYELGPNTILSNSVELFELIKELNLEESLVTKALKDSKRYIYYKNHLIEVKANPLSLLSSGLISLKGLLRIFLEPFTKKAVKEESVSEFFNRKFGKEITEVLVKTFLKGVWAGDIEKLSAKVVFKDLVELDKKEGSIFLGFIKKLMGASPRGEKQKSKSIISFHSGLQSLCFKIAAKLTEEDIENTETKVSLASSLELNTKAISIERVNSDIDLEGSSEEPKYLYRVKAIKENKHSKLGVNENNRNAEIGVPLHALNRIYYAKSIVLATNAVSAADLCKTGAAANENRGTDSELLELASNLASIDYAPIALVALSIKKDKFKKDLDGFGFLSADDSKETLGSIWSSKLFEERDLADEYILLNFIGGALNREILTLSEKEIIDRLLKELKIIYADFAQNSLEISDFQILALKVIPKAIPQLNINHHKTLARLKALSENCGIHLVGNYLESVAIKDALKSVTEGSLATVLLQKKEYR